MAKQKKSNFQTALDELINGKQPEPAAQPTPVVRPEPKPEPVVVRPEPKPEPVVVHPEPVVRPEPKPVVKPEPVVAEKPAAPAPVASASEKLETVIQADTIITGSIVTKNSLTIIGKVEGEVSAAADMRVTGDVTGPVNVKGNLTVNDGVIEGPVNCKGDVSIDKDSLVLGNIGGNNITVSGRVKGNITAEGGMNVLNDAIIMGDLVGDTIQMQRGSSISGNVIIRSKKQETVADDKIFARRKRS